MCRVYNNKDTWIKLFVCTRSFSCINYKWAGHCCVPIIVEGCVHENRIGSFRHVSHLPFVLLNATVISRDVWIYSNVYVTRRLSLCEFLEIMYFAPSRTAAPPPPPQPPSRCQPPVPARWLFSETFRIECVKCYTAFRKSGGCAIPVGSLIVWQLL